MRRAVMKKLAQVLPELTALRNSIVRFQQNMKIAYHKLKVSPNQILLAAYKPLLENIGAAPSLDKSFTTDQLRQHLRYLEGIVKKLASTNATEQDPFRAAHERQHYYAELNEFGDDVMATFVPLATTIRSSLPDKDLILVAPKLSDVMDKVGANFVTQLTAQLEKQASLTDQIMKMANMFLKRLVQRR